MVLYRDKKITQSAIQEIMEELGRTTDALLKAKIEVRVFDVMQSYNANELHIEMRFRDFKEWSDSDLENYHKQVMSMLDGVLNKHNLAIAYSFYIVPTTPPRSMWDQGRVK